MRLPEEAVQEVRRQAMLELEKAVTAAESRASQMIALERTKLESMILEAKRQAQQEVLTRLNKHEPTTNDSMLVSRAARTLGSPPIFADISRSHRRSQDSCPLFCRIVGTAAAKRTIRVADAGSHGTAVLSVSIDTGNLITKFAKHCT